MVRPEDIANYLILSYKRTIFQCDKRKLQKITIYSDLIYYAKNHQRMLDEDVVTASPSGLSIERLSTGIYDLILNSYNCNKDIEDSDISNADVSLNAAYSYNDKALNEEHKKCIDYVFKKLGAYSGDDLTLMSKGTLLWIEARKLATNDRPSPIVTIGMYEKFIEHVINGATADDNDVQNFIVDYLKKLLNDFKKKLNKELNKYGNITDVFIS